MQSPLHIQGRQETCSTSPHIPGLRGGRHGRAPLVVDSRLLAIKPEDIEEQGLRPVVLTHKWDDVWSQCFSNESTRPRIRTVPFSSLLITNQLLFNGTGVEKFGFGPGTQNKVHREFIGEENRLDGRVPLTEIGFALEDADSAGWIGGEFEVPEICASDLA